jgi:hypothetical protein
MPTDLKYHAEVNQFKKDTLLFYIVVYTHVLLIIP